LRWGEHLERIIKMNKKADRKSANYSSLEMIIKMNKKAGMNDLVMSNIFYIILAALFTIGMVFWILSFANGAGIWSDFYAKEITRIVNYGEIGDEIELDVHEGSVIGIDNGVESFNDMFRFNAKDNEVCVRLSKTQRSCYSYFNDVAISDVKFVLAGSVDGKNVLRFKIVEKSDLKEDENEE
jgi:hypothetical protein